MERRLPKLSEGLTWRKKGKDSNEYFECIYYKKQYRNHRIRGSSGTSDPEEAARRLRIKLQELDKVEIYGIRPDRPFSVAVEKLLVEFQGSDKTLRIYAQQADILIPWIGEIPIRLISKDTLRPFIDHRRSEGVTVRTINMAIEVVRMVLRKSAYYWRDENGLSWLENCPIISFEKGQKKKPVPVSWDKQAVLFEHLPGNDRRTALFVVNTGLRESTACHLRWEWEVFSPGLGETIFEIPGEALGIKNRKAMPLVLNSIARRIIDEQRGKHPELVFEGVMKLSTSSWYKAWRLTGLPQGKEWLKGIHNLRHTFGKRLRDVGVDERDIQDLIHHVPKNITREYSEPELRNLKAAVEKIVPRPKLAEVA